MTPEDTPCRVGPDDPVLADVLSLLRESFAYMEGQINPPSSLNRMQLADLARDASQKELWILPGPQACIILTPKRDHLYTGKLAVAHTARGQGLARRLIGLAERRARDLGLSRLQLQTRVELTRNHATFTRLGFMETGRTAHPGFNHPTSVTLARNLEHQQP